MGDKGSGPKARHKDDGTGYDISVGVPVCEFMSLSKVGSRESKNVHTVNMIRLDGVLMYEWKMKIGGYINGMVEKKEIVIDRRPVTDEWSVWKMPKDQGGWDGYKSKSIIIVNDGKEMLGATLLPEQIVGGKE